MVAIHLEKGNNFSYVWKEYCETNNIPWKSVCCYDNDILDQLKECKALLWHINNLDYRDQLLGKNLISALKNTPIKVYPDYYTAWHFDEKVAQKYLFESIEAPVVPSYVFYEKHKALGFIENTTYPIVFKLSKGAGSVNVILVKNMAHAKRLVKRAFGKGFPISDMKSTLKDRYRRFKSGKESFLGVLKGVVRLFIGTPFTQMSSNEKGYVYFQEFLPNNSYDQRIIVIGNKAIGLKRMVRPNDFRASGSGNFHYDRELFDVKCVEMAFDINRRLKFQSMAYDFIYNDKQEIKIVEISYCFNKNVYYDCPGYWDEKLVWHEAEVKLQDWIIEDLLQINE